MHRQHDVRVRYGTVPNICIKSPKPNVTQRYTGLELEMPAENGEPPVGVLGYIMSRLARNQRKREGSTPNTTLRHGTVSRGHSCRGPFLVVLAVVLLLRISRAHQAEPKGLALTSLR